MTVCLNCNAQNRDTARFCRQCGARLSRRTGIGARLGGEYRVVQVIKSGGMGTVYKAESGGMFYAVKEMRDTFTNPKHRQDAINRFMAEALILARLSHPNIPTVHRHFIETNNYYLVMDFIEGADLQAVLDRQGGKGLPEEQVLPWALQICSVLEYLHGQTPPVIFRDLKPANIILKPNGDISLIDFGIAKLFNPARQGTLIGTPGYAAPEQYQGLAEPRSDIFALGATLHHLLTGRDPQQHPPFNFPPATAVNPTITSGMEAVIQKALQMNLEDRWTSTREVKQLLMSLAGPVELEPGVVLTGRYQITGKGPESRGGWQRPWEMVSFEARDLQTDAECRIIPMGADPVEDQFMQQLAGLHHRALPKREVVTHRGVTCFVSYAVEGTPLNSVTIQDPSQLVSIGLQLCDLLETTGSRGAGFSWAMLQAPHILLGPQGQITVDSFEYCFAWLYERRLAASDDQESRLMPSFLSFTGSYKSLHDRLSQEDAEAAEVELVGSAMAFPLAGRYPSLDLRGHPFQLRGKLPGIPPHLEQAILGAMPSGFLGMPWIRSLAQLRQHMLGRAEGPARATISAQRIELGNVRWGETPSHLIRLSSESSGLLYGTVQYQKAGLKMEPRAFVEVHPTQVELKISWDTSELETCGTVDGEVLVTAGTDSFKITVRANVRPSAAFHRTQAKIHLSRKEWAAVVDHCDKWMALEPSESEGYWLRGQAYHELAQYERAASDYTKALQIKPDNIVVLNQRGNAYLALHRYDWAIKDYSEAIGLDPEEPVYYWNRSLAYEYQGRKRDAINDLQQYMSLGGSDTEQARQRIVKLQRF